MKKQIRDYCKNLESDFNRISSNRKLILDTFRNYLHNKIGQSDEINITVICTHNSRRSHFGQIWLAVAADYYFEDHNIRTFSGGTESTAVYNSVIKTLKEAGFYITANNRGKKNSIFQISWSDEMKTIPFFSKKYTHEFNPQSNFAAIMVCDEADAECPIVHGAEMRISLPFQDPKQYDNQENEAMEYRATCREIALEMFYLIKPAHD